MTQSWTQIKGIVRLELKRYLLARRFVGIYLVAMGPLVILSLRAFFSTEIPPHLLVLPALGSQFANLYQAMIRLCVFIACGAIFSQAFRGEIFEKTLHFYLLAPVSRGVIVVGKFLASLLLVGVLLGLFTAAAFVLFYYPSPEFSSFFLDGSGLPHLVRYVFATLLACTSYGAVFLMIGLRFKNPGGPLAMLLAWESFNFALPSMLQQVSVVHHLQPILPVAIDNGPFAIVAEPSSALLGIPGLLIACAAMLAASGWLLSRTQVTYSAD